MRKNIFEILENTIDYKTEIVTIINLLKKEIKLGEFDIDFDEFPKKNLLKIINSLFLAWTNRGNANSLEDLLDRLSVNYLKLHSFSSLSVSMDEFLLFCEAVYNVCDYTIKEQHYVAANEILKAILDNIKNSIEKIGFCIHTYENEYKSIIIIKNEKALLAADKVDRNYAVKIVEYNSYILKGDLEGKKEILKTLADMFEKYKNKLKQNNMKGLIDDIGFLLNNLDIRHVNKESKNDKFVKKLSKKQLEKWYDKTYELIITSIMDLNKIKLSKEIQDFKEICEHKN